MRQLAAILVSIVILTGCAMPTRPGSSADAPIDTTIAAVRTAGPTYDGKYIRVRGLLDQCGYWACGIVPISPDGKVDWEARRLRFNFSLGSRALNISNPVMADRARIALGFLYRFSEVTLVGLYDYTCDSAEDITGKPGELQEITVCTDGGPDLQHAEVATVHRRWPSTAFSGGPDARRLIPLPIDTVKEMAAVYTANGGVSVWDRKDPYRAYVGSFEDRSAYFCVCLKNDCSGLWPTEPWHLPGNPTNPYTCVHAERSDGAWRFQPSFDR